MKLLTAAQMREVDRLTTERFGVPSLQLMESAGTRVVELLRKARPQIAQEKIVMLCGKGNNGGDGFVVARLLRALGARPEVLLFAAPESVKGDAAVNLKRWQDSGGNARVVPDAAAWASAKSVLASATIILDALLGTGLSGPVEGFLTDVIADVNSAAADRRARGTAIVVAVDIPSGLPSDTGASWGPSVRADYTVTFTAPKVGLVVPPNCEAVGEMVVGAIGTPAELLEGNPALKFHWLEPAEFRSLPLRRERGAHKGDYGHALIIAGSRGKSGAAALAAWGALRSGAGLVTVATPANVLPIVATALPETMTESLAETDAGSIGASNLDYGRLETLSNGKSVVALGPGLSTHTETQQFVRTVVSESALPLILDADGLNAFAGRARELQARRSPALAVTPHPGEMARLVGCSTADVQARRLEVALESAAAWNAVVILKGYRTVIATPDGQAFINSTGNPGMATGGTGDVLTGILAGLTAQFYDAPADWARILALGVYLHGLAGDLAAAGVGEAPLVASDLVQALPRAFAAVMA